MKHLYLALATLGILAAMPASADEQRIKVGVGELTCPTCSFTVAAAMRGVPTVEIIDFQDGEEFGTGTYVVTFDDQPWKPYLCLPKRELRARLGRPRAIHIYEQKGVIRMTLAITQPPPSASASRQVWPGS
ncbi:MAG: hypothetical protein ABJO97_13410 [Roseibium sp.]|uniref:hypothetical protein n=1 Tax=Roseibium sp. TaxID=1936156 RepID=UPI003296AC5D